MLATLTTWLFDPSDLTPHGFCLLWQPGLILLHAISDIAIACAYFSIPVALAIFARRRRDLVFRPVFWLFASFILLCGTTHWLAVLTLWVPAYGLEGVVKAITATVSVFTAIALWPLLPKALALPSPMQLKEANAALQASEARFRASFEHSPVPMQVLDRSGRLLAISDTWLLLFGYRREEVIGRKVTEFQVTSADDQPNTFLEPGERRDVERQFRCRDGRVVDTLVSSRAERGDGQMLSVCAVVDITARRRAEAALKLSEERLHQAQKMEAVGQLTGGIAHDFNNMLQGMSGGLEMLERRLAEGNTDRNAEYLRAVRQSLTRATSLTRRMLAFARRQALLPAPTDADALISGLSDLLRRTLGPNIALRLDLQDQKWRAHCDPNQLESALLNLAINARDAMPDGGTLSISTANRVLTEADTPAVDDAAPGEFVEIVVTDTGVGMAEDVRIRAFEPFFTTKPIGQGTGLGLSQLYGFVRQSGGVVQLDSAPGRGTSVRILLPRSSDQCADQNVPSSTVRAAAPDGIARGAVLVVDDEETVRGFVADRLREMGLEVHEAEDGPEGARQVGALRNLDVLVTDVGLPGLNGRQLAEFAREQRPGLRVVLITGYAGGPLGEGDLPCGVEVLHKPFSLDELALCIERALGAVPVA